MAVFLLQRADGRDEVVEADVVGRTLDGRIVLETAEPVGHQLASEGIRAFRCGGNRFSGLF